MKTLPNNSLEVLPSALARRVEKIETYLLDIDRSFEAIREGHYLIGAELLELREECDLQARPGGGNFKEVREKFLPRLSQSAAYRMMSYVEDLETTLPTVGRVRQQALADGKLPDKERKLIDEQAREMDSKSWSSFCRDLAQLREPKKPKHHPRKPESLEDALEAKRLHDIDLAEAWAGPGDVWCDLMESEEEALPNYEPEFAQALLDRAHRITGNLRRLIGQKHTGKAKKGAKR